jgi:chromosome partitioning protein
MKVLATASIKGGVGKTATAVNVAAEATRDGVRVLLWDLDPQGSATYLLRAEHRLAGGGVRGLVGTKAELAPHVRATSVTGLYVVPSDLSLRYLDRHLDDAGKPRRRIGALLAPLSDTYDLVVLDCPPGASLGIESALRATDLLLVPVVPTTLAVLTLAQLQEVIAARQRRPQLLAHVSMLDRRKTLQRETAEELAQRDDVLTTVVPNTTAVERMGPERAPVRSFAPRSPATAAYEELWRELTGHLW